MRPERVVRLLAGLIGLAAGTLAAEETEVPVEIDGKVLFVRGEMNGQGPFTFILDTGATEIVITPPAARRLGVPTRFYSESQRKADLASVSVGTARLTHPTVFVFDPPQALALRLDRGMDYHGILGYPFLSRFLTTVDYGRGMVRFAALPVTRPTAPRRPGGIAPPGSLRVPFELRERLIHVAGTVNGRGPVTWLVDTGCAEVLLLPGTARTHGVPARRSPQDPEVGFADLTSVGAGPATVAGIPAVVHVPAHERGYPSTYDGILGYPFLSRFSVTLNYPERALYLTPAPNGRSPAAPPSPRAPTPAPR